MITAPGVGNQSGRNVLDFVVRHINAAENRKSLELVGELGNGIIGDVENLQRRKIRLKKLGGILLHGLY